MSVAAPDAGPSPRVRPPRFDDPVVDPALTIASMTDRVCIASDDWPVRMNSHKL